MRSPLELEPLELPELDEDDPSDDPPPDEPLDAGDELDELDGVADPSRPAVYPTPLTTLPCESPGPTGTGTITIGWLPEYQ